MTFAWRSPRSLKWRLVVRLVVFQTIMLTAIVILAVGAVWTTVRIIDGYEDGSLDVLRDALVRDAGGGLALRSTSDLELLRTEAKGLWFLIRDETGNRLAEGDVPSEFFPLAEELDHIAQARLTWKPGNSGRPDGLVKWTESAAGKVQIMTGTQGRMSLSRLIAGVSISSLYIGLPVLALMTLATVLATPFVVRKAMAGLNLVAAQAERVDIDQRGVQLSVDQIPSEIGPLVKAVNDALGRLDKGYERHQRFLADAAHELRTPIAILSTRIASLPSGPQKAQLLEDATRLSVLTGQLLDLQRLGQKADDFVQLDLTAMAQRVVVDLAPLAFAAGYEIDFRAHESVIHIWGDQTALERALTNLVQNAIQHGGRRGTITVRVGKALSGASEVEVCDEGEGIPPGEAERIFEPFHRLRHDGKGAGLGLNLVREIVHLHGGHVSATNAPNGGACLNVVLPSASEQRVLTN
ncbi:MAG TPA: HAMP domain-containing sensor histidine kinase [Beijerinckiaceae bacterium]|jgi:signal transduction histidine kinase|nr:HAMP domain-containing sensor histidine kinase [Beijerinckiaceae bacterium]